MRIQQVRRVDGVREGCVPGAGATPVRCTSRIGSAALVAPTPGTSSIQNISGADTERIRAVYETYQLSIHARFKSDHNLIHRRTP
jgi:hypothetical protein